MPTSTGAIAAQGLTTAYEKQASQTDSSASECITDKTTAKVWTADYSNGVFQATDGSRSAQGWKSGVGFHNFGQVLTDPQIPGPFLKIIVWNFAFAILVVWITFALGLFMAMVMTNPKLRGQKI